MNLEDRIKNTGEHLLGSLEHRPDLPDRIHERLEQRAHQRRQRAAVSLGAGVVVVLGGLVVTNVSGRTQEGPSVASGGAPRSVNTLIGSTTTVPVDTTALVVAPSTAPTSSEPVATTVSADVVPTIVAPMGDGAPILYTAGPTGASVLAIDLSTGLTEETTATDDIGPSTASGGSAPPSGALFSFAPGEQDRCGQWPVTALDASGAPIPGFPTMAVGVSLASKSTIGFVEYVTCTEPGTLTADGPVADQPPLQRAWFRTDDPAATLHPIDADHVEISGNDRYLLMEREGQPLGVLDLQSGQDLDLLPQGCSDPHEDPAAGYLIGDDGFAALATCDGRIALVGGPIGSTAVLHHLDGCGSEATLAVRDPGSTVEQNWFAVTDTQARLAWAANATDVSGPIPVSSRVLWYASPELVAS